MPIELLPIELLPIELGIELTIELLPIELLPIELGIRFSNLFCVLYSDSSIFGDCLIVVLNVISFVIELSLQFRIAIFNILSLPIVSLPIVSLPIVSLPIVIELSGNKILYI